MQRVLSLEQAPALSVPLRFFLSVPLFAAAAAVLLFWAGAPALASRWSPATLAIAHLLTLGVLSMAMIGALLQLLPVVAGVTPARLPLTAAVVHGLLSIGTITLATGFWIMHAPLFKLAILFLGLAFGWLLIACAVGMRGTPGTSATIAAMRLALFALFVTVLLGSVLAAAFGWSLPLPLVQLTGMHIAWGLLGWVGLLLIGVAYQVIPMFQVTALYPAIFTRYLAPSIFFLLIAWTAIATIGLNGAPSDTRLWTAHAVSALLAAAVAGFALSTLYLLRHRKRPKADVTTWFWLTSMLSLLACCVLWVLSVVAAGTSFALLIGVLFIVGASYSAINGMLYKIVPFLVWYHLQGEMKAAGVSVPNVKQIISSDAARRQFQVHLAALLLLMAAAVWPQYLARVAALMLGLSSVLLWKNLLQACRIYRNVRRSASAAAVIRDTA